MTTITKTLETSIQFEQSKKFNLLSIDKEDLSLMINLIDDEIESNQGVISYEKSRPLDQHRISTIKHSRDKLDRLYSMSMFLLEAWNQK